MNATEQLPAGTELDKLLSTFFKAELPDPFPALKLPAARSAEPPMPASPRIAAQRQPILTKSRFSLAVSVALLLGGCWYLSSHIGGAPAPRPNAVTGPQASPPKQIIKAIEDDKKPPMMP
jgi:hypothetical protein